MSASTDTPSTLSSATLSRLRKRWHALWRRWGVSVDPLPVLDDLLNRYQAPDRHYHGLAHVAHCLRELDAATGLAILTDAVETALWFHDAVYDVHRHDNEQQSADLATAAMAQLGIGDTDARRVAELILATRHDRPTTDPDACLTVDVDLAILGASQRAFDAYEVAIRREYAHVPDAAFRTGRAAVLTAFLARPAIYSTAHFRDRYEQRARRNLATSIARLNASA